MRKITLVTGSRGEYGYIRPILHLIDKDPDLEYEIIATNMHLLPEFGMSVNAFEKDGFEVAYAPIMTLAGYTPSSMMKSLSVFGLSITDILDKSKPDIILLAGDRGEQFMGAMAGSHMNIPVAHIQAGEVSGNIDGMTRHAIARYTHIHFAANEDAKERLIRSGEQVERVFMVGAPQLDEFVKGEITPANEMYEKYRLEKNKPFLLIVQHPITEEYTEAGAQMETTLKALCKLGMKCILIAPNSDAGATEINEAIEKYSRPFIQVYRNVMREDYAALLQNCSAIVGNSSSGLLEAPTFQKAAVNIGRRQKGRTQGENVINCDHDEGEILASIKKAISPEFTNSLKGIENPYGDGKSSEKIVKILKDIEIDEFLLRKEITY